MIVSRKLTACVAAAMVLLTGVTPGRAQAAPGGSRPKLVVLLVVDQMRADYVEHYGHHWTKGLRRLLDRGAWFPQAAYPYLNTVTCPGHATISTGTFPTTHGMVLNEWWDRATGKKIACTENPQARGVSYGRAVAGGQSAVHLAVPTFADELRAQLGASSRVVTFSLKARGAIMLAGHGGDAVTWFEAGPGAWLTSTAYAQAPVPFVTDIVKAHPVENDLGKSWTRALPEKAYLHADNATGEKPPPGWTATFPHVLKGRRDKADSTFYETWRESPFSDAQLGRMAQAAVDALGLGRGPGTDFLGVSFSALDLVGHDFGPSSHEVQDVLVRLDETLGELLAHLDRAVGAENYVVAVSADHGVAPIPEQMGSKDAGRVMSHKIERRLERVLKRWLGPGRHINQVRYTDIYLAPGLYEKLREHPRAIRDAIGAIGSVRGVGRVFHGDELRERGSDADPAVRAAALSYFPGRSGDFIIVPRPHWFFVDAPPGRRPADATTHGTLHPYDARVPLILMGWGIKPGEYAEAATPADLAPTLAHLCGITLERAEGRVLREALAEP